METYTVTIQFDFLLEKIKTKEELYKILDKEDVKYLNDEFPDLKIDHGCFELTNWSREIHDVERIIPIIKKIALFEKDMITVRYFDEFNEVWGYRVDKDGKFTELFTEWKSVDNVTEPSIKEEKHKTIKCEDCLFSWSSYTPATRWQPADSDGGCLLEDVKDFDCPVNNDGEYELGVDLEEDKKVLYINQVDILLPCGKCDFCEPNNCSSNFKGIRSIMQKIYRNLNINKAVVNAIQEYKKEEKQKKAFDKMQKEKMKELWDNPSDNKEDKEE